MAVDLYMPRYADAVSVTNGTTWNGPLVSLAGVTGLFIQGICTNGAAGTMYLNPTNADPNLSPQAFFQANGLPWADFPSNQAIAANGHAGIKSTVTDTGTMANKFWVSFVPSASGTLYIAVNLTRIAN